MSLSAMPSRDRTLSTAELDPELHALIARQSASLDPTDWSALRQQAHRMLDDMIDHVDTLDQQPVWQAAPAEVRAGIRQPVPSEATDLSTVYQDFRQLILPYGSGNLHPGFMGWAQGGGTMVGMLAEMLAAGMNSNLGGRDHMPIAVEQQITEWVRTLFGFPASAGGLFLTGASQANFVALVIARRRACGAAVRTDGLPRTERLIAYASNAVHGCVPRALDMAGIGSDQLRRVATLPDGRIDLAALRAQIAQDRQAGHHPFLLIGTAGTVDIGAIDPLDALADIAAAEDLHYHVDGALGALGILSDEIAPLLAGIERCDSLAFDFHKWGQVPYDAGFLLVRDRAWQAQAFQSDNAYLSRAATGLAGGDWWPCDYGPDLSRGFRALKTWFTLRTYGTQAMGQAMAYSCGLARELADMVTRAPDLELLAPVALNIVCFGYRGDGAPDAAINGRIVEQLHLAGQVAPSLTTIDGRPAIRAAFVNHRTSLAQVHQLIDNVRAMGADLSQNGKV